jgi:excisionase family DNA binding protein
LTASNQPGFSRSADLAADPATIRRGPQKLLPPSDVAKLLNVSVGWVRDHATRKQPHLPAVKLGKLLRFRPEDVEDFIRRWCQ